MLVRKFKKLIAKFRVPNASNKIRIATWGQFCISRTLAEQKSAFCESRKSFQL
jgi:hypothetical protein